MHSGLEPKPEVDMKTIITLLVFFCASIALCEENSRPHMSVEASEDQAVKELLNKMSRFCTDRNFRGFIGCFTPNKASSIRKQMENAFICGTIDVDILDFFVISAEEDSMSFGVRYFLTEGESEKVMCCSKMVAKKLGDSWLIDSEDVRSRSRIAPVNNSFVVNAKRPAAAAPKRPPVPQAQAGWRHPNPANGGEEAWLPPDMLYMPGPSCANGNCRVR